MSPLVILAALALTACATTRPEHEAQAAAFADAGTTLGAVAQGGVEANPLLSGSPAGIVGVFALKLGLVRATAGLEPETRATTLRAFTGLWTGAAANNTVVLLGGASPLALAIGLSAGLWAWTRSEP